MKIPAAWTIRVSRVLIGIFSTSAHGCQSSRNAFGLVSLSYWGSLEVKDPSFRLKYVQTEVDLSAKSYRV